jgi:hypothetical protein
LEIIDVCLGRKDISCSRLSNVIGIDVRVVLGIVVVDGNARVLSSKTLFQLHVRVDALTLQCGRHTECFTGIQIFLVNRLIDKRIVAVIFTEIDETNFLDGCVIPTIVDSKGDQIDFLSMDLPSEIARFCCSK